MGPVNLGDLHRHLVNHLDGRHDRAALAERLQEAIASGKIRLTQAGQPSPQVDPALLTLEIDHMLARLSESALLVA